MHLGVWKRKNSSTAQKPAIQNMGGVGIVFLQAPDKSLFVKSLVEGSGASHSGIKLGDCLMKVDGVNVFCKGADAAAKIILGPLGTVVELTLARVVDKKRLTIFASLVREMKATADPLFDIRGESSMYSSGVTTKMLFLECLQPQPQQTQAAASSSLKQDNVITSDSLTSLTGDVNDRTEPQNAEYRNGQVFFKGRWYSEVEVQRLESMASHIDEQIKLLENSKIDVPNPCLKSNDVDNPGIVSAIFVVQGGPLLTTSKSMGISTWKEVKVKISTGGLLTWGNRNVRRGQVLWARAKAELYSPAMTKNQFDFINRKFEVLLEAGGDQKPICAFSIDGGTVQAAPSKAAIEFVASDEEERNRWVSGISAVLLMRTKSTQEQLQRKQLMEPRGCGPPGGPARTAHSVFLTERPSPVALPAGRTAGPDDPPEGCGAAGLDRPPAASPASVSRAAGPTSGSESGTARRATGSHLDPADASCHGWDGGCWESESDPAGGGPQSRQTLWTGRVALVRVPPAASAEVEAE